MATLTSRSIWFNPKHSVRRCSLKIGGHIRFCGDGGWRFRFYSESLGKAPSNQTLLPLTYGASPRLAMPSLRSCSVGPPPSAIHGRGRLPRHPCRGAPCATPAFGLWERGKQIKIKSHSHSHSHSRSKDRSLVSLDSSYRCEGMYARFLPLNRPSVSSPAAFDLDAPRPREAEWRFCVVGNPAWMPG